MALPLVVRAIRLSLDAVDRRLEEAARTLGAGRWRTFRTITLPLCWPGVLAGAVLGFALPLSSALRVADSVAIIAAWAFIALVAQLVAYALVALLLKDFPKRINRGEMAAAVLAAAIHVSVGLLNSAAMNY